MHLSMNVHANIDKYKRNVYSHWDIFKTHLCGIERKDPAERRVTESKTAAVRWRKRQFCFKSFHHLITTTRWWKCQLISLKPSESLLLSAWKSLLHSLKNVVITAVIISIHLCPYYDKKKGLRLFINYSEPPDLWAKLLFLVYHKWHLQKGWTVHCCITAGRFLV